MKTDRRIWKKQIWLFLAILLCFCPAIQVQAAQKKAEISVADNMVAIGDLVEVTIKVSGKAEIGTYFFHVTYDDALLEYQSGAYAGGNGVLTIMGNSSSKEFEKKIKFLARKQGTSQIKIDMQEGDALCPLDVKNGETMKVSVKNGEVLITPLTSQSGDTSLSDLKLVGVTKDGEEKEIALSPEFTSQVYQYKANAAADVESVVVTALCNDLHATVEAVKGTKLKAGENLIKITVRAENGDTKSYMIYITKAKAADITDKKEEEKKEKQTSLVGEKIKIKLADTTYYTVKDTKDVQPDEGLEWVEYAYKGDTIVIAQGVSTGLKVFYLTDKDGKNGKWYLYNESNDSFSPYVTLSYNDMTYSILPKEDKTIPSGYEEFQETWDDITFDCYKVEEDKNFCLIYAMNGKGEKNLYRVDVTEKTIQRYDSYDDENIDASASKGQLDNLKAQIDELKKEKTKQANEKWACVIVLGFGIIILAFFFLRLQMKAKKRNVQKNNQK